MVHDGTFYHEWTRIFTNAVHDEAKGYEALTAKYTKYAKVVHDEAFFDHGRHGNNGRLGLMEPESLG